MDSTRVRNLTLEEILQLQDKAKRGDQEAIIWFVRYSIWKSVGSSYNLPEKDLIEFYDYLMSIVTITVIK